MTTGPMAFRDRRQAGLWLGERLLSVRASNPVIYALPRGGVPVGLEVARILDAPMDLMLVRKIGAPNSPEVAAGAVVDGAPPQIVRNEDVIRLTGATEVWLQEATAREIAEMARRRELYLHGRPPISPRGRTAIVVDDGLATGATALAAIRGLRSQGAEQVILAVPVAPPETARQLAKSADRVVCLLEPERFHGVGAFYLDFHQLTDEEVLDLLAEAARDRDRSGPASAPEVSAAR